MAPCDSGIEIRRARESDARSIAHVHVATWRVAYRAQIPSEVLDSLSVDTREAFWSDELRALAPDRRPWLAIAGNGVAGFVSAGRSRDGDAQPTTGEIYAIYVLPDCWQRGLGRQLLDHAERDLGEVGCGEATLWVLAENRRARSFYEALGWRADGAAKSEQYGGREIAEVRYRRALESSGTEPRD